VEDRNALSQTLWRVKEHFYPALENSLIHEMPRDPMIIADGNHFSPEAREIIHIDLSEWGCDVSYGTYSRCPVYLDFLREVRSFAVKLARCIDEVPEWQPDWPIMEAEPMPEARADIPRLWGGTI
jgi:hypothetical protein